MKIIKIAGSKIKKTDGKQTVALTKSDWEKIGIEAGWMNVEAKKKKKVNPWAVCKTTVPEGGEKQERCIKDIKKKQHMASDDVKVVEAKSEAKSTEKKPTEHGFMDQCLKKNKDAKDPGAYCASIVDKAKGTTDWRKGPKKD